MIRAPKPPLDLPETPRCSGRRERAIALVHEGHDLVADVGVVAPRSGRVDVLAAPVRRPGVDVDDDAGRDLACGDPQVGGLREGLPEGRSVSPHLDVARVALEDVDGRVAAFGLVVVAGRDVDAERPLGRIAERVVAQRLALEDVLVDAAGEVVAPGLHGADPSRRALAARGRTRRRRPLGRPYPLPAPAGRGRT